MWFIYMCYIPIAFIFHCFFAIWLKMIFRQSLLYMIVGSLQDIAVTLQMRTVVDGKNNVGAARNYIHGIVAGSLIVQNRIFLKRNTCSVV